MGTATGTPGKLPITPEITPGFAVGGVILILTGVVYTVVGIKNKWLHTYLSAAYLAAVAVTVLIIYVMNPPVSNALQGAYLVAVAMTGLILGGGAIIFTEMTEGLGCLLGGFCFSMWLLVLKPGGLVTSTGGKSIFIAAFTIAMYATSFTHYTRPYGLIVSISFAGATVVVLGIDCFSRAGLKELWAYIWDLNDNLFPLGADTYPLTRGMKVEIAAIIIIFLAGIVFQMKLWKVIKERREQRAAERLQDERTMEQEEENVGRRVEHSNAAERNQWEAVYGDKDAVKATESSIRDSGVGDMDSQKKGVRSTVTSIRRSGEDEIEMSEMVSPTLTTGAGLVMPSTGQDGGAVTVRVARDPDALPEIDECGNSVNPSSNRLSRVSARSSHHDSPDTEKVWVVAADGEARLERRPSRRNSKQISSPRVSVAPPPEVVPLPFKVPEGNEEDDRSSIATFADDEQAGQNRNSKHLSTGSAFMRRLSRRSSKLSDRNSKTFSRAEGPSMEDLVIPRAVDDDRASSVAATVDGLSDDEDMRSIRSSSENVPDTSASRTPEQSTPVRDSHAEDAAVESLSKSTAKLTAENLEGRVTRPVSGTTVATKILEPKPAEGDAVERKEREISQQFLPLSTDLKLEPKSSAKEIPDKSEQDLTEKDEVAPTVVSVAESKPASISKDNLPQLSKVVMSYRTNEWAKHLSGADAPDLDELKLAEYSTETETASAEAPAPVSVEALQQTPENAAPPPAPRSVSQISNHVALGRTRPSSAQSGAQPSPYPSRTGGSNGFQQDGSLSRSMSQQSLHGQLPQNTLNTRGLSFRSTSSPLIPQPIVESPIEEDISTLPNIPGASRFSPQPVPFGSTTTLIGKRDTMLRSKTFYQGSGTALASTPEFPRQFQGTSSDAGSVYNYPNNSTPMLQDNDSMSLSARRNMIRQSSLYQNSTPVFVAPLMQTPVRFDTHQPQRQSSAPSPMAREQQLANWRANVAQDLQSAAIPQNTIERSRSALWQERQLEEQRKQMDAMKRGQKDSAFDERMRRGDMLDAHREALRKMQASANKHA
jgi:hypothetical protein